MTTTDSSIALSQEDTSEAANRSVVVDGAVYTSITISPANPDLELLREFHELCLDTFGEDDVEDIAIWENTLQKGRDHFTQAFHVVVRKSCSAPYESEVVGGAAEELYKASGIGLMTYICVLPSQRGRGLASHLVEMCLRSQSQRAKRETTLLIEVEQVDQSNATRHGHQDDDIDCRKRQIVWHKLGFQPLALTMEQPGQRGGVSYQFAVYAPHTKSSPTITNASMRAFILEYHASVGQDEGLKHCSATPPILKWLDEQPAVLPFDPSYWK